MKIKQAGKRMNGTIFLLYYVALSFCAQSCDTKTNHIQFIIPKDFRGSFAVFPDDPNGIKIEEKKGIVVMCVPKTGILKIKGDDPFISYKIRAVFDDGETIKFKEINVDKINSKEILLIGLGTRASIPFGSPNTDRSSVKNSYWWFVGSQQDWDKADYDSLFKPGSVRIKQNPEHHR